MKNIVWIVSIVFLALASTLVDGEKTSDSLMCYICESELTDACQETPDVSVLASADCKDLHYTTKSVQNETEVINNLLKDSTDGKFRGGPLLQSAFQDVNQRSAEGSMKYVCLTVSMSSGERKGITRSCQQVPKNVKNVCDFLKKDLQQPIKIDKCKACDSDYCNSSPALASFTLSTIVFVFLIFFNH